VPATHQGNRVHIEEQRGGAACLGRLRVEDMRLIKGERKRLGASRVLVQHIPEVCGRRVGGRDLEVVVKFTAEQAPYVQERVWHETQSLQVQADGSLLLHMQASGRFEIVRWILGWGEHVKVLEPRALRQEVAEHLRLAAQQYASHLRAPGAEEQ
jgi:predicted DNA-binding transcriptional regulator YafY